MQVTPNGKEYPIAPVEPEEHDHPSAMYLVAITPHVARAWLRYNRINRNQRETGRGNYSSDMKDGNFQVNGATITFTRPYRDGEDENVPAGEVALLDGQHRLEACAASNQTFITYVGYGFDPEVRHTVDTGIKRTYSDTLRMRGEKDSNVLASVVKKAYLYHTGNAHLFEKKRGATHSVLDEFFTRNKDLRRSAEVARTTHTEFKHSSGHELRQSVTGLAHGLFLKADEASVPEYFARLGDGALMEYNDPIMHLRRRIVQDLTKPKQPDGSTRKTIQRVPDWQYLCYYIRAWNAHLVYHGLTDSERAQYTFAMLGPNDSKRIPSIMTAEDAYNELVRRENRRKRAEKKF